MFRAIGRLMVKAGESFLKMILVAVVVIGFMVAGLVGFAKVMDIVSTLNQTEQTYEPTSTHQTETQPR